MPGKLLYIATRWPWPVETGRQRMIDQSLRFAVEGGWDVTLLYAARGKGDATNCPIPIRHHRLQLPKLAEIAWNLHRFRDWPLQTAAFTSRAARAKLASMLPVLKPDVAVIDMVRMASFLDLLLQQNPPPRLVLDMDDVLSNRYAKMRHDASVNLLGMFARTTPWPLPLATKMMSGFLLRSEESRIRRQEELLPPRFDVTFVVSKAEASQLQRRTNGRIVPCPPAVEQQSFRPRNYAAGLRVVFVGSDGYEPNREALLVLEEVAQHVVKRLGDGKIQFEAAGRVTRHLPLSHVRRTGFVADLGDVFTQDAILVAPITSGSGVKTKILDAMSYSVPVVTTPLGVEGLDAVPGRDLLVGLNSAEIADYLIQLNEDRPKLAEIANAGWRYVQTNHSRESTKEMYLQAVRGSRE